ncbi:MAG TPA: hypothetical protein PKC24_16300, partial [Cyclobacteriaceae bacterium]|nr:hypothetical protein [Cyclobacteriaceae bacterium]
MKKISINLSILSLLALLMFSHCGEDTPAPDVLQERITELKKGNAPWELGSTGRVMKNGFDVSDQFANFRLAFGDFTYNTQGGVQTAWPASGTWQFENGNANQLRRNDDVLMTVSVVNNRLTLSFNVTGLSGGKSDNV